MHMTSILHLRQLVYPRQYTGQELRFINCSSSGSANKCLLLGLNVLALDQEIQYKVNDRMGSALLKHIEPKRGRI